MSSQIRVHWLWQGKSWSVADSQDNSSTCGYCYSVELIRWTTSNCLTLPFPCFQLSLLHVPMSHHRHTQKPTCNTCVITSKVSRSSFLNLRLHPNHHLALHLHEYILQYGPIHSWWTFPYEQLIGIIQRIPNNGKQGNWGVFATYTAHNGWQANLKWQSPNHMFALQIFEAY